MSISIVYDLSRLVTRVLNATPNGIDRIDMLLARHFFAQENFRTLALGLGFTGPRVLAHKTAQGVTERAGAAWREDSHAARPSLAYETVVARLGGGAKAQSAADSRIVAARPGRALNIAHAMFRHVPPRGPSPVKAAPQSALYLNATHFPLEWKRHVAWLDQRPDVKPVFWIHDLLAVERPEWFWGREPLLHEQRLDLLARRGYAAAVASACVERSLQHHMDRRGRRDLPIFRLAPPVEPIFSAPQQFDERLANVPFFLVCGTIEPRKNHLLLLRVWRELIKKMGGDAPKLVVVGKRGWNNAEIVASMEDPSLREHLIEVAGLPTPDYKRLVDHCLALLAPSLAEGFGLPVAEALAAGAPVLASDIPSFREQEGKDVIYLDPLSDGAWREAVLAKAYGPTAKRPRDGVAPRQSRRESAFFEEFDAFIRSLAS